MILSIKQKFLFNSGKGGVGKTIVSIATLPAKIVQAEIDIVNQIKDRIGQATFLLPFIAEERLLLAIIKLFD